MIISLWLISRVRYQHMHLELFIHQCQEVGEIEYETFWWPRFGTSSAQRSTEIRSEYLVYESSHIFQLYTYGIILILKSLIKCNIRRKTSPILRGIQLLWQYFHVWVEPSGQVEGRHISSIYTSEIVLLLKLGELNNN